MAGSERTTAAATGALLAVLLLGGGLACASTGAAKKGADPASATVQEPVAPPADAGETTPAEGAEGGSPPGEAEGAPPPVAGEDTPGPTDGEEAPAPAPKATDVVVISEGGEVLDRDDVSLYEASRRARHERGEEPAGSAGALVITNQTLEDQTPPGRISFGTTEREIATGPPPVAPEPEEGPPSGTDAVPDDAEEAAPGAVGEDGEEQAETAEEAAPAQPPLEERNPELYWRNRIREARLRWREAVARVEELQGLAGQLRYDFYATDDPWLRDSSIKPAWDRTLVDLEESRQEVDFQRRTVEAILLEGRRSGALPGWLREGLELEPDEDRLRRPAPFDEHEAIEPVEVEDDDGDGGGPGGS